MKEGISFSIETQPKSDTRMDWYTTIDKFCIISATRRCGIVPLAVNVKYEKALDHISISYAWTSGKYIHRVNHLNCY